MRGKRVDLVLYPNNCCQLEGCQVLPRLRLFPARTACDYKFSFQSLSIDLVSCMRSVHPFLLHHSKCNIQMLRCC